MATRTEARLGYVPHFEVTAVDGRRVRYQDIWQHRNLVLVVLPAGPIPQSIPYVRDLLHRAPDFDRVQTSLVVTTDGVPGVAAPGAIVADQWGEIQHVASAPADDLSALPDVDELLSWIRFVRMQCPECPP